METQTVNVVGVGYIGSLISLHLLSQGNSVTAVDRDEEVLDVEKWFSRYNDIQEESREIAINELYTTTDYSDLKGDITFVCVNTPAGDESVDLSNVKNAMRSLGSEISPGHKVILRSTVPPGTAESEVIPILEEESGLKAGKDFYFCYAPEFIRGGTGLKELRNPSKTVLAGDDEGKSAFRKLMPYSDNLHETSLKVAEAVKYFDNAFHGLKISLANECGRIGHEMELNPAKVMEIISSDYRLNASDMYMKPGKAYGGPCLRKDIQVLKDEAESKDTDTPVISSINESNEKHNAWLIKKIKERNPDSVGLIGAAYKEGFNSKVNSPCIEIARELEENGNDVAIHDPDVEVKGFKQEDLSDLKDTDLCVIFHQTQGVESFREEFDGDLIDLQDFNL